MELWIRSQNKQILRKIDNIFISRYDNSIYTNNDYQAATITLGKYKNRERCMQILDEIQGILCPPRFPNNLPKLPYYYEYRGSNGNILAVQPKEEIAQLNTFVYQMPEE